MGYVNGTWVDLVRIDNAHDQTLPAHRHVFHPDRKEDYREFVAALPESLVGWAQEHLTDEAQRYFDEYRRELANMTKGGSK
jgi:predicted HAD superfamily phosphohydrolase YqeG